MKKFYAHLRDNRADDVHLQNCIQQVVNKLEQAHSPIKPGMLLGKIQSGKTRAFLGVIAEAFDRGYDIAIVLTKGTKTLAQQTVKRINRDFRSFIDQDEMCAFDIMSMPSPLTKSELKRKLVIVSKKEANNLDRLIDFFSEYPEQSQKRVLLIDDEADFAGIKFSKEKGENSYKPGSILTKIDSLREILSGNISFLQVTATPYSLYLQPDDYENSNLSNEIIYPRRPIFTELVPIHSGYIGGDDYFGGFGENDPRGYLYIEVNSKELSALRSVDERTIRNDRMWTSENIKTLRRSLISFLLSVAVRRHQQRISNSNTKKYSMVIHIDTQKQAHDWQSKTVSSIIEAFSNAAKIDDLRLKNALKHSYGDIKKSVIANKDVIPNFELLYSLVKEIIIDGEINIQIVNSGQQLEPLLDQETAELRLRTQANLFIGGSILDRGITIPNLIAFFYGRNPKRMQADTVLQHSRMYGNRDLSDLAVTRFYTSQAVYNRMNQIHRLDSSLRQAFELGDHNSGVVFIQNDDNNMIIPCAPNKVSLSDLVTVKPNDFLLPTSFNTITNSYLREKIKDIDKMIPSSCINTRKFAQVSLAEAHILIEKIEATIDLEDDASFEWNAMRGLLQYLTDKKGGKVLLLAETGREISRAKSDKSGLSIIGGSEIRSLVRDPNRKMPALILLKQNGGPSLGWKGGPFWWPVLASPPQAKPCVFAKTNAT